MIRLYPLLAACVLWALPLSAAAATFGDTVMVPGLLAQMTPATAQSYRHARQLPQPAADAPPPAGGYRRLGPQEDQILRLSPSGQGSLVLRQDQRTLGEFPATAPHPVLLMFLENVMRTVAQETGGSPHYIRNRMRHALGAEELRGDSLQITPFAEDRNRDRMGAFAGLEIEIRWQPGQPGQLTALRATLPADPQRYTETLTAEPGNTP